MTISKAPAIEQFRRVVDALNASAVVASGKTPHDETITGILRAAEAVLGFARVAVHPAGASVPPGATYVSLGGAGDHATDMLIAEGPVTGSLDPADRERLLRLFARRAKAIADANLNVDEQRSRVFAAGILDAALDAIVTMTLDGRVAEFNPAAEAMFRISREEAVGRDLADLMIPPSLHDAHRTGFASAATGHPSGRVLGQRIQVTALRADGEPFPCEVAVNQIDVPGEAPRFTAFLRDISLAEGLRAERDVARHEAEHDELTGLLNRAGLDERLVPQLAELGADPERRGFAACADIDDFGAINAAFGTDVGDNVLTAVAERLGEAAGELLVSRTGSDEFVLAGCPSPTDVERLVAALDGRALAVRLMGDLELQVRLSVGLVRAEGTVTAETLLTRARSALRRAKQSVDGRAWFTPGLDRPGEDLTLVGHLRRALANGEFELHYQPIMRSGEAAPVGYEALLRWRRADGTLIAPAAFIPVAESSGLIEPIGEWVIQEACRQLARWSRDGSGPDFVSVNVSPRQLRRDDLADIVSAALAASDLAPNRLWVEVTETAMLLGTRAETVLRRLSAHGVRCALDDFGADYSSLSRLAALPVSLIKLDRSFLTQVPSDPTASRVAAAILDLCAGLELETVAEGVETAAQLEFLHGRATMLQGFHLGRPLPAAAISP